MGEPGGKGLPSRHGPWTAVGVVREDRELPHKMSFHLPRENGTNPSLFGIFTFASVWAFKMSASAIMPFAFKMYATTA